MNLTNFETLIRHTTRLIYTDPVIHLIVDFIIEHSVAEVHTFAFRHKQIMTQQV